MQTGFQTKMKEVSCNDFQITSTWLKKPARAVLLSKLGRNYIWVLQKHMESNTSRLVTSLRHNFLLLFWGLCLPTLVHFSCRPAGFVFLVLTRYKAAAPLKIYSRCLCIIWPLHAWPIIVFSPQEETAFCRLAIETYVWKEGSIDQR